MQLDTINRSPRFLFMTGRAREFFRRGVVAIGAALSLSLFAAGVRGEDGSLTRQRVAELVRTAPSTRAAGAEANVSRAAVTAAGVLSLDNPVISGLGGIRFNPDGSRPFSGVATVSWPVDIGGKGDARVEAAKADYRAATASAANDERTIERILRDPASSCYSAATIRCAPAIAGRAGAIRSSPAVAGRDREGPAGLPSRSCARRPAPAEGVSTKAPTQKSDHGTTAGNDG